MEKRSPASAAMALLVVTPCLEPSRFLSWFLPFTAAPSRDAGLGSLLATTLLVGPLARECAKQLKKWDFCFCIHPWGHAPASGGV